MRKRKNFVGWLVLVIGTLNILFLTGGLLYLNKVFSNFPVEIGEKEVPVTLPKQEIPLTLDFGTVNVETFGGMKIPIKIPPISYTFTIPESTTLIKIGPLKINLDLSSYLKYVYLTALPFYLINFALILVGYSLSREKLCSTFQE